MQIRRFNFRIKRKKPRRIRIKCFRIFGSENLVMKSAFSFLFILSTFVLHAQSVSNYRYIIIPQSFTSFEEDQFHLGPVFKQFVKNKSYEGITENPAYWPSDMHNNPCRALTVDMEKERSWRKNIILVHLKNCEGQILETFRGESSIKDYKEGYQDAMRIALKTLKPSHPTEIVYGTIPEPKETVRIEEKVETKVPASAPSISLGTEFKSGNTIVQLTELKDGSLALIEKSSNTVIALLKPTSRAGIYQATVTNGNHQYTTVGYYDGETIGIDYLNSSNEFELKEFKKVQ